MDTPADKQKERQTVQQTDRPTDRQTNRQTENENKVNPRFKLFQQASFVSVDDPLQIIIPLSQSCDAQLVQCLEPRGILFVHLNGASNLPSKGGMRKMFGQADPDGYAKVNFGAAESM